MPLRGKETLTVGMKTVDDPVRRVIKIGFAQQSLGKFTNFGIKQKSSRTKSCKMAKEKASGLVKTQFILFGILLLIFFVWANRKCTRSQSQLQVLEEQYQRMNDSLQQAETAPPPAAAPTATPRQEPTRRDTIRGGQMQIIRDKVTPLYITIENLALRQGPGLNYEILDRLSLFEEVSFLNEVTDSSYTLKLGQITTTEPWVKIRSRKGRDGWVYGAGVDYYKHKLEGVD